MNDEQISLSDTTREVQIIHSKGCDFEKQRGYSICGTIDSVSRFCEKREFNQLDSFLIVDREKMVLNLTVERTDPYVNERTVIGSLEMSNDFKKWQINTRKYMPCKELAEFIKMNRSAFESKDVANNLVVALQNVKVNVDKEIEKCDDNRASVREQLSQRVISSTIPENFTMRVRLFKGSEPVAFNVELYVHPSTFDVCLISPDANDLMKGVIDSIIDDEIKKISALKPQLVIVEQ